LVGNSRRGIVLNIAELRLYFYTPTLKGDVPRVITHPVSIGRMDWRTPLGTTSVTKKERDPPWRPPPSIRREHALDGDPLPEVIPGGSPDNPLGRFALRLGFPSYLIHGVDERKAYGIGMRVTHGCVRMYPEDIESLFAVVPVGTPVMIVNEPIKLGRQGDSVLLEVHQPLEEGEDETAPEAPHLSVEEVIAFVRRRLPSGVTFDEDLVAKIAEEGNGIPTEIARAPLTLAGVPMARPEVLPTGQSQLQKPRQKPQSALDEEYERAVSRYLTESDTPTSVEREATKIEPRRTTSRPRKATLPDVQRYVEDHY
jgi:L,D-transpeptidase ErfK/SrfK